MPRSKKGDLPALDELSETEAEVVIGGTIANEAGLKKVGSGLTSVMPGDHVTVESDLNLIKGGVWDLPRR